MKDTVNVRRYWAALVIALALVTGIYIGIILSRRGGAVRRLPVVTEARPLAEPSPVSLSGSFERIASKVTPAVVNINTESIVRFSAKAPQDSDGGLFNHFFHMGPEAIPRDLPQESLGSGVILDKNGFVLTNYHVIMQDDNRPVDTIRVHLQGGDDAGRGYRAKVVGYDKWTDLAVIKINAQRPLPVAELGDSDTVRVGDWVVAIGSPFGLNATVTAGIISAKEREINNNGLEDEFKRFLQTDAPINPGNSGGPLVNLAGQVIGINTEIATSRGVYDGVGFAIPSRVARKVYDSIVTTGAVRRGAIGVAFSSLQSQALLRSFGADHGVVVESVEAGGPAAHAGLHLGDVITAINSQPIHNGSELLGIVSNTDPGQKLHVDFLRKGKTQSCNLTVADWSKIVGAETSVASGSPPFAGPAEPQSGGLGLSVQDLRPEQAKALTAQLRLASPAGVRIENVEPGSFADDLGLERFDVILGMNHQTVHSVKDFNRLQSHLKSGQDVLFLVARRSGGGYSTFFFADPLP